MQEIHANVYIDAPIERVFDAISDHERFLSNVHVRTTVTRAGTNHRNGLGALREVWAGTRIRYLEEITAFERPSRFDYLIRESTMPVRHHGAQLRFTARGEGTEVDWTSRVEVPVPVAGPWLERLLRPMFTAIFTELLLAAKARLEGESRTAPRVDGTKRQEALA